MKLKYTYYWAFGSNLCIRHMAKRCPNATKVGKLVVNDALLVFRGVADCIYNPGTEAQGGIWRITRECEKALDRYEGVEHKTYEKCYFDVALPDGRVFPVLYYKMTAQGIMPPSEGYLDTIREGYRDFGLDHSYLSDALHRSWSERKVTYQLEERYKKRGSPRLADPTHLLIGGTWNGSKSNGHGITPSLASSASRRPGTKVVWAS